MRLFKMLVLVAGAASAPAGAAALPSPVRHALRVAGIPESSVGIVVQGVDEASPSVSLHADRAMQPASVMKLITTYAGLELLGPAYHWRTEVYLDGDNVVLRGYGDPKLDYEGFWTLLRNLRGRGLKDIRGDVVLDRTWFGEVEDGQGAERIDNDVFRPYNVTPDALLVNFRSIQFNFVPQADGVRVYAEPSLPGLDIVNTLKLSAARACPDGSAFRQAIGASFRSAPPRAAFSGDYPVACGERQLYVALTSPEDYVSGVLRELWGEMGGTWGGRLREGTASARATLFYRMESEPLALAVRDINKYSNNVMARQLYLTLAAELGGAPARPELARAAIAQWLASKKIRAPELVMQNGSGLSRVARVSPATLADVLRAAWRSPVMPELVASLPVVAVDGTMKKRLVTQHVAGHAHVKTGRLRDVRSVAGYVLDRHGERHVVVMLVNDPRADASQEALDALLEWVYEGPTGRARSTGRPRAGAPLHP